MRTVAHRTAVLVCSAVLAFTACGGDDGDSAVENAIERAGGGAVDVDVDEDTGAFRVETDEGTIAVSGSSEVPADWPEDVPLLDGLVVTGGSSIDGGSAGRLVALSGTTSMSVADVEAFYADALAGWDEALRSSSNSGGEQLVNVTYQQDERTLAVGAVEREGGTEVSFSYTYFPAGTTSDTSDEPADLDDVGIDARGLGIEGADEALDAVGPEVIAGAVVSALDAERYEIVDGTVHLYLGDDSGYDSTTACIVAGAVLDGGTSAIVHDASGASSAC